MTPAGFPDDSLIASPDGVCPAWALLRDPGDLTVHVPGQGKRVIRNRRLCRVYGDGLLVELQLAFGSLRARRLFLPGTRVVTENGSCLVTDLRPGDILLPGRLSLVSLTRLYVGARFTRAPSIGGAYLEVDGIYVNTSDY